MTRSAQNQVDTAMALTRLMRAKEEGRGCKLGPDHTKALLSFVLSLTATAASPSKHEEEDETTTEPDTAPTGNGGSLPLDEKPAS